MDKYVGGCSDPIERLYYIANDMQRLGARMLAEGRDFGFTVMLFGELVEGAAKDVEESAESRDNGEGE